MDILGPQDEKRAFIGSVMGEFLLKLIMMTLKSSIQIEYYVN